MKGFACVTGSMLKETMCISETLKLTTVVFDTLAVKTGKVFSTDKKQNKSVFLQLYKTL